MTFQRAKLGGAWFFVAPALLYGIFTSRLPAIKNGASLDDAQIGALLLALGLSTLAGLMASGPAIEKFGAEKVSSLAVFWFSTAFALGSYFDNYAALMFFCLLAGLGVGFCDVGMNAIGIDIEKTHKKYCLSFLHGCSCIGGVAGSLGGSLFAWLELSPFLNFMIPLCIFLPLWPLTRGISSTRPDKKQKTSWRHIGFFVFFCGFLSLLCHVAEGGAGEWGSVLLHASKNASPQQAALVFAFFTGAMLICRFSIDSLRCKLADSCIVFAGSLAGAAGMSLVLLSPWPWLCLCGYAVMGAGLGPVAPIVFSRAGAAPGIEPARASAVVSIFSYAGMLLIPPFLGLFSKTYGLDGTLWILVAICLCMAICAFVLKKQ